MPIRPALSSVCVGMLVIACGSARPGGAGGSSSSADAGGASGGGSGAQDAGSGAVQDGGSSNQDAGLGGGSSGGADSGGGGGDQDAGSGSVDQDAGSGGGAAGDADAGGASGSDAGSGPHALTQQESASALAIDGANIYWVNRDGNDRFSASFAVRTMPKSGGGATTLFTAAGSPEALVADGEAVFVTASDCTSFGPCASPLFRVEADGSGGRVIGSGRGHPAVDGDFVYVTGPSRFVPSVGQMDDLLKLPKHGGPPAVLDSVHDCDGTAVAVWGGEAFWALRRITEGDTFGDIVAVPIGGGSPRIVFSKGNVVPPAMKIDVDWIYFRSAGSVFRVSRTATFGNEQLLWEANAFGQEIDANAHVVYWDQDPSTRFAGCVGRANADGTDGRCLDQGNAQFRGVRVDDTAVYYIKDGQIWRTDK